MELQKGTEIAILSIGPIGNMITNILQEMNHPKEIGHFNMRFIKPLDKEQLKSILKNYNHILIIEDGCKTGGFGSSVLEMANEMQCNSVIHVLGIEDRYVEHGKTDELYALTGLNKESVMLKLKSMLNEI